MILLGSTGLPSNYHSLENKDCEAVLCDNRGKWLITGNDVSSKETTTVSFKLSQILKTWKTVFFQFDVTFNAKDSKKDLLQRLSCFVQEWKCCLSDN